MSTLDELRSIADALRAHDAERGRLVERRDDLIAQASAEGATWVELQDAAGLSSRGMALAMRRVSERR